MFGDVVAVTTKGKVGGVMAVADEGASATVGAVAVGGETDEDASITLGGVAGALAAADEDGAGRKIQSPAMNTKTPDRTGIAAFRTVKLLGQGLLGHLRAGRLILIVKHTSICRGARSAAEELTNRTK
jgi:hypothetical protein